MPAGPLLVAVFAVGGGGGGGGIVPIGIPSIAILV